MHLESIYLKDFRNFACESLAFNPGINLLVGKNAQGKTNIIEAVSIIANGRSFRAREHRDTIRHGALQAEIRAGLRSRLGRDEIAVSIGERSKKFLKNGKRTTTDSLKGLGAVLFAPEEIVMLRDSPGARRLYIDSLISKVCDEHRIEIKKYEKIVRHRNILLKEGAGENQTGRREIALWDEQLAATGAKVVIGRDKWCSNINEFLPFEYSMITKADGEARFVYKPHCGGESISHGECEVRDAIMIEIDKRRADEAERRVTLVGPHRDDFDARVETGSLRQFGSQGQHRTFVLALKMAEADILRNFSGEEPILLLDDVASELDEDRNRFLFDHVSHAKGQVFITATNPNDIRIGRQTSLQKFVIDCGKIVDG